MRKKLISIVISVFITTVSFAQDTTDISKLLEAQLKAEDQNKTQYITATFKTTRLINGHSVENTAKGVLDLRIDHRFDPIGGSSGGAYNFFGLDHATMRLGFDYGLTNRLMIGIGRSTEGKIFDGFFKLKILRQATGKNAMPVTVSYVPTIAVISFRNAAIYSNFSRRLNFTNQLIIGRKFTEGLSLQTMPTIVHRNYPVDNGPQNVFAIGVGGRQKLSKRTSFNVEYYYQLPAYKVPGTYNSFSVGFDIETGSHVFQVHLTNSTGMTESSFIPQTIHSWGKGEFSLGFNISRVFTIGKKHTKTW